MKEVELRRLIMRLPINAVPKLVLLAIKDGVEWETMSGKISIGRISRDIATTTGSTCRGLRVLIDLKLVTRERAMNSGAQHAKSFTSINVDRVIELATPHHSDGTKDETTSHHNEGTPHHSDGTNDETTSHYSDGTPHHNEGTPHHSGGTPSHHSGGTPPIIAVGHSTITQPDTQSSSQSIIQHNDVESFAQFIREEEEREDAEARRWPRVEPKLNRMQLMLIEQAIERREINREYSEMNKFALRKFGIRLKPWKR